MSSMGEPVKKKQRLAEDSLIDCSDELKELANAFKIKDDKMGRTFEIKTNEGSIFVVKFLLFTESAQIKEQSDQEWFSLIDTSYTLKTIIEWTMYWHPHPVHQSYAKIAPVLKAPFLMFMLGYDCKSYKFVKNNIMHMNTIDGTAATFILTHQEESSEFVQKVKTLVFNKRTFGDVDPSCVVPILRECITEQNAKIRKMQEKIAHLEKYNPNNLIKDIEEALKPENGVVWRARYGSAQKVIAKYKEKIQNNTM